MSQKSAEESESAETEKAPSAEDESATQTEPDNDLALPESKIDQRLQAAKDFWTGLKAIRERAAVSAKESADSADRLKSFGPLGRWKKGL